MRGHVLAGGPASQPQPPVERQHEGLGGVGDSFAVGLGAVAEACVGRGSGQTRMPPRERQHEGLGERQHEGLGEILLRLDWEPLGPLAGAAARGVRGEHGGTRRFLVWGILLRLDWEPLRGHVLAGGPASHACRRGSGSTRG